MCWPDKCKSCGKTTWSGCGLHIDKAMEGVPMKDRCDGWEVGSCPKRMSQSPLIGSCKYCEIGMTASTQLKLCEILIYHMQSEEGKSCREKDKKKYPKKWKLIEEKKLQFQEDAPVGPKNLKLKDLFISSSHIENLEFNDTGTDLDSSRTEQSVNHLVCVPIDEEKKT
mmetsp:Transcript_30271/g.73689  ORF Transcript_30271/g.73689 Transcript_30271/m.73689 type:complete len:168 (-) Transcript_30271:62-565(-)